MSKRKMTKRSILLIICIFSLTSGAPNTFTIPFPSSAVLLGRSSGSPFTITVEGNIGAGKSTLLNFFMKYPDMTVHKEPLDIWQNLNGTDFLDLVYKDKVRWGMTFESLVTLTMTETHLADKQQEGVKFNPVKVMERSLHSARTCFMEQLKPVMTAGEMAVLDGWYNMLTDRPEFDMGVDLIVYLRTSPEVAMSRVKSRGRQEEQVIPYNQLQRMHQLHEDWLIHKNSSIGTKNILSQVIIIDANQDISILAGTYSNLAKMIWRMIPKELRTAW
eukprot:GFUD01085897.1.p1 GENE.GFUD01085897.1~~GFUD01085897.1.p1  ORF type:complete len:274 (-),score=102.23 GFUD01085897.1:573-1394(-)